jgi:hypothetical protein
MHNFYIIVDTISLAIILGIMFANRKQGNMGGGMQMGLNKNKKF